ncbi:hypothetical protein DPX39_000033400 [Trypanosoma brucei equiperdum]|uniref:Uncharacterized protein n=1 Tax=Trypanosoma brucei equiperdum TaxID=630700 RepID=A0A3L6KT24_9TRYP|nr:hypothetical protein DPX39_000033400 [Trypanosoma brucei equiperdum]
MSEELRWQHIPEVLRNVALMSRNHNYSGKDKNGCEDANHVEQGALATVSQLLERTRELRELFVQVVEATTTPVDEDSAVTASFATQQKVTALGRHVALLQSEIRTKNLQCARVALRAYLAGEVDSRRRTLARMQAALSIAKQSI